MTFGINNHSKAMLIVSSLSLLLNLSYFIYGYYLASIYSRDLKDGYFERLIEEEKQRIKDDPRIYNKREAINNISVKTKYDKFLSLQFLVLIVVLASPLVVFCLSLNALWKYAWPGKTPYEIAQRPKIRDLISSLVSIIIICILFFIMYLNSRFGNYTEGFALNF